MRESIVLGPLVERLIYPVPGFACKKLRRVVMYDVQMHTADSKNTSRAFVEWRNVCVVAVVIPLILVVWRALLARPEHPPLVTTLANIYIS
jgi:hypothetical protein